MFLATGYNGPFEVIRMSVMMKIGGIDYVFYPQNFYTFPTFLPAPCNCLNISFDYFTRKIIVRFGQGC